MIRITPFTLAIVAALGIAVAPAPAAADRDDVAKIILGLAVAGIVAKVIDDRKDRKRSAATQNTSRYPYYESFDDRRRNDTFDNRRRNRSIDGEFRRRGDQGRRNNRGFKQYALPNQCLRFLDTARGDRQVYGSRCLQRNYKFAKKLPRQCEIKVRTNRGVRTVYGRRCLARDGWQVAGRR